MAADFGCGSGGWVIPLAEMLEDGRVYAIDMVDEPLSALRAKIKMGNIRNIDIIKSDVEKTSKLISQSSDLVLMTNLLFEVSDMKKVLEEGKRVLKPGGFLLVVDWIKDNPLTPEKEWVDFAKIKEYAGEMGLKLKEEFEAGRYHYGIIFKKILP